MSYQKWTHEEELKLKLAVDKYGNDWDVICAEEFPQRRVVCLKNKYYCRIYNNPAFKQENSIINTHRETQLSQNEKSVLKYIKDMILQ
ncbi:Conserved_hypothetical protein [Hexamita inflata]|uniref:Myb-like domain-containing protein n=1 Tax=Hexamita inflata TaxID=28002 RepID=A0AA86PGV9_9EUKA|nr:Conserved hypothetical protein [Hexamita inflata]CAI9954299.1 Conserved hypothetical protein [Hexamita inflata]